MSNEELLAKIQDLQNQIDLLKSSASFPQNVANAIVEKTNCVITSSGNTGSAGTQLVNVPTTPVDITVPAQPSGTIPILFRGTVYNVLYK